MPPKTFKLLMAILLFLFFYTLVVVIFRVFNFNESLIGVMCVWGKYLVYASAVAIGILFISLLLKNKTKRKDDRNQK